MKSYGFITVGSILKELKKKGLKLSRGAFYRLEAQGLFQMNRTIGKWRRVSVADKDLIIDLILDNYGLLKK